MPGLNGTGPMGQGSLTGRGRGFCVMPLGYNSGVPYKFSGMQSYPSNVSNPYSGRYSGAYISSYNYTPYPLRSSRYSARSAGYLRGRGRSFLGGIGMRGRGRRF